MSKSVMEKNIPGEIIVQKKNGNYVNEIRSKLRECANEIAEISHSMDEINYQGGWESFWNKSDNIKSLSRHVNKVTNVQQKTLDLVVLLMGGLGVVKKDYNLILDTIEDLSEKSEGDIEVLNYLVKIKRSVNELKKREELQEKIIGHVNQLAKSLILAERDIVSLREYRREYEDKNAAVNKLMEALLADVGMLQSKWEEFSSHLNNHASKLDVLNRDSQNLADKFSVIEKMQKNMGENIEEIDRLAKGLLRLENKLKNVLADSYEKIQSIREEVDERHNYFAQKNHEEIQAMNDRIRQMQKDSIDVHHEEITNLKDFSAGLQNENRSLAESLRQAEQLLNQTEKSLVELQGKTDKQQKTMKGLISVLILLGILSIGQLVFMLV